MTKKLILFDALSCIYRSFFAIKGLSTSAGLPVNALYGFLLQMDSVISDLRPTHVGVVFDGGLSKERLAIHIDYKANRPEMPEDLRKQLPLINRFLDIAGIYWFLGDGIEADDAIASMVRQFRADVDLLYIVTSDKDMFQLVDDRVRVLLPGKDRRLMDEDAVAEKTGVKPSQIIDWISLVGDSSDNIPGVPGVGTKTAASLLADYGSIEGIVANLEALPRKKISEALQQSRNLLLKNMDLVTLKNVECGVVMDELIYKPDIGGETESFLKEMELNSILDRMKDGRFFS